MSERSEPTGDGAPPAAPDPEPQPDEAVTDADLALDEAAAAVEADLAAVASERDNYLESLRRVQADFENYKKQTIRRNTELIERASEGLARNLLPVLDAGEAALAHGANDVKPVYDALLDVLVKEGLTPVRPEGEPFDPTQHEAVIHEPADGDDAPAEPTVSGVLRTGYLWKGRVLRAAMVKVRG